MDRLDMFQRTEFNGHKSGGTWVLSQEMKLNEF